MNIKDTATYANALEDLRELLEPKTGGVMSAPWEYDDKFTVGIPMDDLGSLDSSPTPGVFYFRLPTPGLARLVSTAPELRDALTKVLDWLEGTEAFAQSHGAHSDAVEARKLLTRITLPSPVEPPSVSGMPLTITDIWIYDTDGVTVAEWHEGDPEPKPEAASGQTITIRSRSDGTMEVS